jgi:hypothetical protein
MKILRSPSRSHGYSVPKGTGILVGIGFYQYIVPTRHLFLLSDNMEVTFHKRWKLILPIHYFK